MNKVFPDCDVDCEYFLMNPQICENLKAGIQKLIDQGIIMV